MPVTLCPLGYVMCVSLNSLFTPRCRVSITPSSSDPASYTRRARLFSLHLWFYYNRSNTSQLSKDSHEGCSLSSAQAVLRARCIQIKHSSPKSTKPEFVLVWPRVCYGIGKVHASLGEMSTFSLNFPELTLWDNFNSAML